MARRVTMVALAVFLAQASGVLSFLAAEPECEASCPEDEPRGECPLDCQVCLCCAPLPVMMTSAAAWQAGEPRIEAASSLRGDEVPPSPDPDEILHVPKLVRV